MTSARTWFENLGDIGNSLGVVDAHLLVAGSVQLNIVEHVHEDGLVWKVLRRGIPRISQELMNLVNVATTNCDGVSHQRLGQRPYHDWFGLEDNAFVVDHELQV